jgi:hypothetical protein
MNKTEYEQFIERKSHLGGDHGFDPLFMPDCLFDFQKSLVDWACRKGRAAVFADCGLGKTLMQLVWAQNIVAKTNGRVLLLTPLAVSHQTVNEALRFDIEAARSGDGKLPDQKIVVTNYERLHYFDPNDFEGVVCDESSILKNFDGSTKKAVTEFARKIKYRSLWTATAAPNDFIELGTSSEALGQLGFMDMLGKFFKQADKVTFAATDRLDKSGGLQVGGFGKYRFRGHAEQHFWRWICSWARAVRKPSDLGFSDNKFKMPELTVRQHIVESILKPEGFLFDMPAITLDEQRGERRRTLNERCEMAAELVNSTGNPAICWCHLNPEGDLLAKLIPDAVQVSGSDSDDKKEEKFRAFESGEVRVMVSKPTVAGFGLNWQHCAHQTFFPSHSFEQWYQAIRRCWRFGQKHPVRVDVITTEGEQRVMANLQRKADAAERMFEELVKHMTNELKIEKKQQSTIKEIIPSWL